MMFTIDQQRFLLDLARCAVTSAVTEQRLYQLAEIDPAYSLMQGAFVTLTSHGNLRGCIGYPEPVHKGSGGARKAAQPDHKAASVEQVKTVNGGKKSADTAEQPPEKAPDRDQPVKKSGNEDLKRLGMS